MLREVPKKGRRLRVIAKAELLTLIQKKKKQMGNLCMPWVFGKFLRAVQKLLHV